MRIAHIDIHNFRKLKSCRVDLSEEQTVFVGANNSGKTSAMDALIRFLEKSERKDLTTTDFTLSNWSAINKIGEDWCSKSCNETLNLDSSLWKPHVPAVDIWLKVEDNEVHYASHIIPTLDWSGGLLGVRLIFEPKNLEDFCKSYMAAYLSAKSVTAVERAETASEEPKKALSLWPQSLRDFLDRKLHSHFVVRAYILDPSKHSDGIPQTLPTGSEPLDADPFDGLFKIDIIKAQRGFSDSNAEEGAKKSEGRLSAQLREYYKKHLDPAELPEVDDLDALGAIDDARTAFDAKMKKSFSSAINELEGLNYPGFSDPQIVLSCKVNPLEGLDHDAAVQFNVIRDSTSPCLPHLCLPEKNNGLGYQNLIYMFFKLIGFRDEWMRVGKAGKSRVGTDSPIEPLHLVLIEEPEAHLHAQVQQVFIRKALGVLRSHANLGDSKQFCTQMVVSTHSSHIAHEIEFTCLRYFQRTPAKCGSSVPCANVVNLTNTFGDDEDTSKFASRYLKTTHCDLFFADAAILVEGSAEMMLIPHFIRGKFPDLDRSYISLLEIGGSHAHRLKPLIESLGLLTLVVTDLDSVDGQTKVRPEKGKSYKTSNNTLKEWIPCKSKLDDLLSADSKLKETADSGVRVAYQGEMTVAFAKDTKENAIPYTFEDALVLSNLDLFKSKKCAIGLIKKMADAVNMMSLSEASEAMFEALAKGNKAEMALELLYTVEPNDLQPPEYIKEGLTWLQEKLEQRNKEFLDQTAEGGAEV